MSKENPKIKQKKEKNSKKEQKKIPEHKVIEVKKVKVPKRQKALNEKKIKLAVKARQTKWAPVWVVMKKYGAGKKIHPSATTAYRRSWRRTKLHIKPRKIRKWHLG
jgi:ribosomal protein L39E